MSKTTEYAYNNASSLNMSVAAPKTSPLLTAAQLTITPLSPSIRISNSPEQLEDINPMSKTPARRDSHSLSPSSSNREQARSVSITHENESQYSKDTDITSPTVLTPLDELRAQFEARLSSLIGDLAAANATREALEAGEVTGVIPFEDSKGHIRISDLEPGVKRWDRASGTFVTIQGPIREHHDDIPRIESHPRSLSTSSYRRRQSRSRSPTPYARTRPRSPSRSHSRSRSPTNRFKRKENNRSPSYSRETSSSAHHSRSYPQSNSLRNKPYQYKQSSKYFRSSDSKRDMSIPSQSASRKSTDIHLESPPRSPDYSPFSHFAYSGSSNHSTERYRSYKRRRLYSEGSDWKPSAEKDTPPGPRDRELLTMGKDTPVQEELEQASRFGSTAEEAVNRIELDRRCNEPDVIPLPSPEPSFSLLVRPQDALPPPSPIPVYFAARKQTKALKPVPDNLRWGSDDSSCSPTSPSQVIPLLSRTQPPAVMMMGTSLLSPQKATPTELPKRTTRFSPPVHVADPHHPQNAMYNLYTNSTSQPLSHIFAVPTPIPIATSSSSTSTLVNNTESFASPRPQSFLGLDLQSSNQYPGKISFPSLDLPIISTAASTPIHQAINLDNLDEDPTSVITHLHRHLSSPAEFITVSIEYKRRGWLQSAEKVARSGLGLWEQSQDPSSAIPFFLYLVQLYTAMSKDAQAHSLPSESERWLSMAAKCYSKYQSLGEESSSDKSPMERLLKSPLHKNGPHLIVNPPLESPAILSTPNMPNAHPSPLAKDSTLFSPHVNGTTDSERSLDDLLLGPISRFTLLHNQYTSRTSDSSSPTSPVQEGHEASTRIAALLKEVYAQLSIERAAKREAEDALRAEKVYGRALEDRIAQMTKNQERAGGR